MNERAGSPGAVLVVDDDVDICGRITNILGEFGLEAICVHSDEEAYAHLDTMGTIHALLVDLNLGRGTTGFDVARRARSLNNDLPVIYISGEPPSASFQTFGVADSAFLQKPFTGDELLQVLRAGLAI